MDLLLDKKADIEAKNKYQETPLHRAAQYGRRDIVDLLLEKNADIEAKDGFLQKTPLHLAAERRHRDIVDLLLDKKADIEAKNKYQETPLHRAAQYGRRDIVDLLLEKNADIEAKDGFLQKTPLHLAAERGHRDIVDLLLEKNADIEAKDGFLQKTPLHLAAERGHRDIVDLLLEKNADIEAKDGFLQKTPLHLAAERGHRDIVDLLLEKNADIEAKDGFLQKTPLHLAAERGHRDIVDLLLEKNADIEAKDGFLQKTPLHLAAERGHRDIVDLLLEKNADIEAKDGFLQKTPLHLAAERGHRDIVDLLLEKNADIEAKDGFLQKTPLHLAAERGHRDIVDLLLEKNADIEAKDGFLQKTPLHLAAERGHRDIVDLLLEKNADIEAKAANQRTPLHRAALNERLEVVTLLLEKGADLGAKDCHGRPTLSYILDLIENFLKSWPQNAFLGIGAKGRGRGRTELKRASVPERLRTMLAPPWKGKAGLLHNVASFSAQNLFWAQEVPVTLKHLPGVWGSDAVNEDFLKALADCPHDGIFETDAVQVMVLAAWQQYRAFTLLEIVSCCLTVICLCWASYGFRHGFALSTPSLYVVAALHLKKSLDESVQAVRHLVQCLTCSANQGSYMTFDNAADALYLVGGWLAIDRQLSIGSDELEKPWMAVFAAAAWLRLLYSLRAETWMGPRLLPILSAVKDTFAFFLLMVICIASAAHGYYNLQLREEPTPTYAALMQVVRLGIFGDFDLFEFEGLDSTYRLKDDGNDNESQNEWEPIDPSPGPDYVYVHVLFYMTGVGITVLLMNVLIGVLSSNYERYEAQSVGQFFRARVKMLVELQGRPLGRIVEHIFNCRSDGPCGWLFACLRRRFCRIMFFILFVPCLACLLIIMFLACLPFFRLGWLVYTIRCSLGWFGSDALPASECRIFLVVRDEPDGNEVRSLRTLLKIPLEGIQKQQQDLESKIEKVESTLENHHQDLESKIEKVEHTISQIHELLLEVTRTGRRNSAEEPEGLDAYDESLEMDSLSETESPEVESESPVLE